MKPIDGGCAAGASAAGAAAAAAILLLGLSGASFAQGDSAPPPAERADTALHPEAPPLADDDGVAEEIVVTGIREDGRKWRVPTLPEEAENDWRRRDASGDVEVGRIEVGRASVYQDLLERRQYDAFRDEYRDPRPQTSFRIRFGKPRE
jgi:hypothetical protein